ncbi:MAG: EAL domain-containing protein [Rhodopila sp.]|jgi:diguanylate cyclase (GGDEF)-like protein
MNVQVDRAKLAEVAGKAASAATGLRRPWQDLHVGTALGLLFSLSAWRRTAAETGQTPPPRTRSKPAAFLWAGQIALGLLIAGTTTLLLLQLRTSALAEAEHELRSLALILADQAERAFEGVDIVQTTFLEMVQAEGIQTPEGFRQRMSGIGVNKELDDHGSALPQLDVIGLVDTDGKFINVSHHWPAPPVSVADREYFKTLKAEPHRKTFVSDPIMNRLTHTMAVVVAHKVSSPDGDFLGISFAGVLMSYFEKLYQTVVNRPEMSIGLFRKDGMLLARFPHLDQTIGQSYLQGGIVGRMQAEGSDNTVMQLTSRIDGLERLVAGHTLANYPMVVTVSSTVSSILSPWRKQATYLIVAAILLELVVAVLGMLMLRQVRSQSMLAEARAARAEAEAATRGAEAEVALSRERERANREMHVQHVRFGAALGNMSQALCMFDTAGGLVVANRRLAEMFDLPPSVAAPGMTIDTMRTLVADKSNLQPADMETMFGLTLGMRPEGKRAAYVRELTDGRSLAVNSAPVEDDGWLVTLEDITEHRQVEARIAHMAHHDALTGLPNRVLFHERLAEAVARGRRGETSAVLFLDLDHFKAVNDTLGHPVGDALLKEVTQRLLHQVRETDTVARLGGDEFAIVQSTVEVPDNVTPLALRIIEAVSAPYEFDGHQVTIGTSIGIAVIPNDGDDPNQILKNADMALYRAKSDGRGRYRFFEPEMNARMQARRTLELDLRKALNDHEFEVFYQPLINLGTRSVCGFEALVRWRHPDKGLVQPSDFIPVAEETGLIVPLGDWVLRQACRDAMTWPNKLKVAVNLSPVQFGSRTLVADINAALRESGLEPERLELEITETVMLEGTDAVLEILHQLRNSGVRIALDDFGTGYSSLSYLRRFPFSKVKIDRSFIEGLGTGGDCNAIVAAVTNLCETLGMATTAEGVETAEQLKQLSAWHCTEAQGYLFSYPRPAADVADMCERLSRPELIEWD